MRKSLIFLSFILLCSGSFLLLSILHPLLVKSRFQSVLKNEQALVRALDLTDLCLFLETRYTRHLSQADMHSALQDHPMALDHFPSGSFTMPPTLSARTDHEKN